jgi:hypothetical protein
VGSDQLILLIEARLDLLTNVSVPSTALIWQINDVLSAVAAVAAIGRRVAPAWTANVVEAVTPVLARSHRAGDAQRH